MPVQGVTVTLTTDLAAAALAGTGSHGVMTVVVRNRGAGTVYLGSSGVSATGYPMSTADAPLTLKLYQGDAIYASSTGAAAVLDVLRLNETT